MRSHRDDLNYVQSVREKIWQPPMVFEDDLNLEPYTNDCVWAQLVQDWENINVAGIIMLLGLQKPTSGELPFPGKYKAVGWNQSVQLSLR